MATEPPKRVKIVVVGDGSVGKTCLVKTYANETFPEEYTPTVIDNYDACVTYNGVPLHLDIWDTAGQEDYENMRALSYFEVDVFILCYSVVSHASYQNIIAKWAPQLTDWCPSTPIILCGTKTDLRNDPVEREKLRAQGRFPIAVLAGSKTAAKINAVASIECSSLHKEGHKQVFDLAINTIVGTPLKELNGRKDRSKQNSGGNGGGGCLSCFM